MNDIKIMGHIYNLKVIIENASSSSKITKQSLFTITVNTQYICPLDDQLYIGTIRMRHCKVTYPKHTHFKQNNTCISCNSLLYNSEFHKLIIHTSKRHNTNNGYKTTNNRYLSKQQLCNKNKHLTAKYNLQRIVNWKVNYKLVCVQTKFNSIVKCAYIDADSGKVEALIHHIHRAHKAGQLNISELYQIMKRAVVARKEGKRYTPREHALFGLILTWGGPRLAYAVSHNSLTKGPCLTSIYSWRKKNRIDYQLGMAEHVFKQ